jgi:hypothetical protein
MVPDDKAAKSSVSSQPDPQAGPIGWMRLGAVDLEPVHAHASRSAPGGTDADGASSSAH